MVTQDKDLPSANDDETKHQYEGEMEHQLKELGKRIDELIDRADASKEQSINTLRLKKAEADNSLQELKASGKEAWLEFKQGMDRAWTDLQTAWSELSNASERARAKFNK